jgi:hypothetical protein
MCLRGEIEVFGEAGRLDDPAQSRLAPLAADAGAAQRLGQPASLADELLLLVDDPADETAQLAALPALVDADLLDGLLELGELGQRCGRLAPPDKENQDGGACRAGEKGDQDSHA